MVGGVKQATVQGRQSQEAEINHEQEVMVEVANSKGRWREGVGTSKLVFGEGEVCDQPSTSTQSCSNF